MTRYGDKAIREIEAQGWTIDAHDTTDASNAATFKQGKNRMTIAWTKEGSRWRQPVLTLTTAKFNEVTLSPKAEFTLRRNPAAVALKEITAALDEPAKDTQPAAS